MTKEMMDSQGNPKCPNCEGQLEAGDVEYCQYCKPKSSTGASPQTTQHKRHRSKYEDTRTILKLKCVDCGKTTKLNVGDMSIYTDEVKKTWTCCLCSDQRKKSKGFVKRACKILAKDDKALTQLTKEFVNVKKSKTELVVSASPTVCPKTKLCKKCKQNKFLTEFGKDKAMRDGLYYICKTCTKGGKS